MTIPSSAGESRSVSIHRSDPAFPVASGWTPPTLSRSALQEVNRGFDARLRRFELAWGRGLYLVGKRLLPLLLPLALLLLWQIAVQQRWTSEQILPAPARVYQTFIELWRAGDIQEGLLISLRRIGLGFLAGASAGLVLGSALGISPTLRAYLEPVMRAWFAVPSIGWIPILILIFGIDEALKIIIVIKAVMVPIIINTLQGIRGIPRSYVEVAEVLRLRAVSRFFRLTLPAALPLIVGGIRLGLSNAFVALVVVEMLAATEGLGYMMVWGRTLFQLDIVIVGMVVIGLVGLLLDRGLRAMERRWLQWEGRHG